MTIEADTEKRALIPTKFSASMLAETNSSVDLQTCQVVLVRDKESKKWGLPAGKTMILKNEVVEEPFQTVIREWCEETGNLPMNFSEIPHPDDTLFSYNVTDNTVSMGFVFSATLDREWPDQFFKRNSKNILTRLPRKIDGEFETDRVGLFNYHQVMKKLEQWKTKLYRPDINGDILLDWCNNIASNYGANYFPGTEDWDISRESLGFTWIVRRISWKGEKNTL